MHEPAAEDGPQPAALILPERRAERRPPLPRAAGILGGEHHQVQDEIGERRKGKGRQQRQKARRKARPLSHAILD